MASRRAARVAPPPNEEAAIAAGRIEEELGVDLVAIARPHLHAGREPFAEKIARHSPMSVMLVPAA